jgi:hypothetical protein
VDDLRQAFVDRTLEVSLHAAGKAATFAKNTPNRPPGHDAKAKKAAADNRTAAATKASTAGTKHGDGNMPPTKK